MKRVDNYVKSVWTVERNLLTEGMTREENEAHRVNEEHHDELLKGCNIVDRVIATRETTAGAELSRKVVLTSSSTAI